MGMLPPTTARGTYVTSPTSTRLDLRLVALVFAVAAATLVLRAVYGKAGMPFFADTDDAMRVVMVRDLLAGQGWYDMVQHRLNTPWGAELHWSRLIDLCLVGIIWLLTPFLGADGAALGAGYVWPLLLLAVLLWLSARLAWRLVGPDGVLPALVLPMLSPALTAEFTPGRVDHHNVVILLTLALALTAVEAIRHPRAAALCGFLAATALAIATEALPGIVAAILVLGMIWVLDPARGRTTRLFGLAFAGGAVLHLAIARPPDRWLEAACDMISPVYVGGALVVGAVFTVVTLLPAPRPAWGRFVLLGVLGLAGAGAIVALYPECLGGPYVRLDPWLQDNWIGAISEAKPWAASLGEIPAYTIAVSVPVFLALVATCIRVWKVPEGRPEWAALLVFLLLTSAVMLVQLRGARLAIMPAIPAAAWFIVAMRQRYLARQSLANTLALAAGWLVSSGLVLGLAVAGVTALQPGQPQQVAEARASKEPCLLPEAFAGLRSLPPARVMTPIDLGAHLLLETQHTVVAAPYHRNGQGVMDAFRFFNEPIATAREIVAQRGVTLVVTCPAMAEMAGLSDAAPDSFVRLAETGALPGWLTDISTAASPLRVYAVQPQ